MNLYKTTFTAALALSLGACDDFVDIKTQGGIIPDKVENFRYLLNNTDELIKGSGLPDIMSDDVAIKNNGQQYSQCLTGGDYYTWFWKTYTWADQIFSTRISCTQNQIFREI